MGRSGRRRTVLRNKLGHFPARLLLAIALFSSISLTLAGCSGGSANVEDLLLGHGDFPNGEVTESNPLSTITLQGVSAVQVDLTGASFTLNQSIVMFQTQASALLVLAGIKQDQLAQRLLPTDTSKFEEASAILNETRGGQDFYTLFFVQGLALVKLTLSGQDAAAMLPVYAEMARSKVSRQ